MFGNMCINTDEVCGSRDARKSKCSVDLLSDVAAESWRRRSIHRHYTGKALVVSADFSDSLVSVVGARFLAAKTNSYFFTGVRRWRVEYTERVEDVGIGCKRKEKTRLRRTQGQTK